MVQNDLFHGVIKRMEASKLQLLQLFDKVQEVKYKQARCAHVEVRAEPVGFRRVVCQHQG
jgi:hypothetical protein